MKPTITYQHRGQIERGTGEPGYNWHEGYSETNEAGDVLYPWLTRSECHTEAKARGCKAVFKERNAP